MKTLLSAIALSVALPAMAHAQAAPAPAPAPEKKCCCEKMAKKMDCCEEHGDAGHDEHAGHDMSQHDQHPQ